MASSSTIWKATALAAFIFTSLLWAADSAPVLLASGRIDDAIAALRGEISTSPNDAAAYNLLCRAYYSLGDWDRGVSACEKAVSLDPNNSTYHWWLGRVYGEKADAANFLTAAGLAKKVRNEFERAVQLNPNSAEARKDLAEFYLEAPGIVGGGQDKARAQAATLVKLDPIKAHWVVGRIAEKKKDPATAEREYRSAIDASNGNAEAWLGLAMFYRHVGRFNEMDEAVSHIAAARVNDPVVLMDAAQTLISAGRNFSLAGQLLHQYLSLSASAEEAPVFKAHYLLGTVLEKQGNNQAAAQEYRASLSLVRGFSRAQQALERVSR
jgi:tetratricopeptide (TPR) repeat protein